MPKYTQALSLSKDIVLIGDLNCDLLSSNPRAEALRSFCTSVNATHLIYKPTRVTQSSSTLINVVLVSNPTLVKSSGVSDITISDHFLVYAVPNLTMPKPAAINITKRSFKNYHAETFAVDISCVPWDVVNLSESIDDKLDAFNDLFLACLNEHAPVKTIKIKHRSIPFITEEIKQLFLTKYELHKRARQSHNPNDWMAFRSIKQKVKRSLRQAEIDYYNNEIKSNMDNTGAIWKPIRHALPTNSSSKQCLQYTKDTAVLADEFNDFFTTVGKRAALASTQLAEVHGLTTPIVLPPMEFPDEDLFYFKPVSSTNVQDIITKMPNNKAPGYDKVPVRVLKDCLPHI